MIHMSYPRPLMCQKEFLLFYMSQLWPYTLLQKRQFFTFTFEVFLLNLFYRCILLYRPIYGVAVLQKRTNGSHAGILLTGSNLVIFVINTSFADEK